MSIADWANTVYGYFFVFGAVLAGLGILGRHAVHRLIEEHLTELRTELKPILEMMAEIDLRTSKIEYAIYNEGKTGLINKVDNLLENQQAIKIDVEVMKAKVQD